MRTIAWRAGVLLAAAACRASAPAPAPPVAADRPWTPTGAATTTATAAQAAPTGAAADAAFMQSMIAHHAQALTMTALVPERAARAELRPLAERIAVTQRDEIALMRRWLERRGAPAATDHASHAGHAMPGMLTDAELARLGAARGAAFDRLFLELMIRHHEGALAMVAEYFKTPGAGQEPEAFRLASDVDADQRAEIRRMRALLP
ncbi:DUF305 domain-containing protein [Roseisolibacter sp. H3M3-2]|uniref:DUF305 domain-containing protein n=1 Tax=Roseisolibacter sp. H3M3-2 TaxID=3031323 RepID=UPI0023DB2816|nr:DUF305 domain-containing protein [Roseisolibacter sp. H3M3-2]MDF1503946.1 DUF305 domain-containing protein [Roseisolibacter sp. H3M3-2]